MPIDYKDHLATIKGILFNANTTTAAVDLSASLTSRVPDAGIFAGDIETKSIKAYEYPCVFVRAEDKSEEFVTMGITGGTGNYKQAEVTYNVVGLYRKEGMYSPNETLLEDVYNLARNIEAVFRGDVTLGGTCLWCNPETTDFIGPFENNGIWIKGVSVKLKVKYHFR
jgi:hypothetical protein